MEKAYKTPNEDLMNKALKDYEEASTKANHWNSSIPKAIKFYFENRAMEKNNTTSSQLEHDALLGVNLPDNKALEEMVEKLQGQTAEEQGDDLVNKMGMLYFFVKKYVK